VTAAEGIDFAVVNAAQLVRVGEGARGARRGPEQGQLDVVADGALVARDGRIVDVGPTDEIVGRHNLRNAEVFDASGMTVLPGLVDAHTHPLFAGLRYEEYAERLAGLEMSAAKGRGGGIWWTVEQTRQASDQELAALLSGYLGTILRSGTTTAEAKSGYGQTVEEELRHLAIIDRVARDSALRVVPTLLGAHIVPGEYARAADYVEDILHGLLPRAAEQGIARFCDTSLDRDFTPDLSRRVIAEAQRLGLPARLHTDGSSDTDGWAIAAAVGAASADHLTSTPVDKIARVGATDTVAVLLPAAELYYFWGRAAARDFIRANVPVAIATDFCSSIHAASLFDLLSLAAPWYRMTPEEVIAAVTVNAAYSLGVLDQVGTLDPGKSADLIAVGAPDYRQIIYDYGAPLKAVIAGGVRVGRGA
jgi:imidazolonepropionase